MRTQVKAALIGCGYWGNVLLKSALNVGIIIDGLIDQDGTKLRSTAPKLPRLDHVHTSTDLSLLDCHDFNAVIIATPPPTHAEYVKHCLDRGLHVYCEKPLAMSLGELEAIGDVPDNLILQGGYQYALMPVIGLIGKPNLSSWQVRGFWYNDGKVRDDIDGRLNTLVHPASMMVALFWDEWRYIMGVDSHCGILQEDKQPGAYTVSGTLVTEIGIVHYVFDTSWRSKRKVREFSVVTDRAEYVFNDVTKTLITHQCPSSSLVEHVNWKQTPVEHELKCFRDAIQIGRKHCDLYPEPLFTQRTLDCLGVR